MSADSWNGDITEMLHMRVLFVTIKMFSVHWDSCDSMVPNFTRTEEQKGWFLLSKAAGETISWISVWKSIVEPLQHFKLHTSK